MSAAAPRLDRAPIRLEAIAALSDPIGVLSVYADADPALAADPRPAWQAPVRAALRRLVKDAQRTRPRAEWTALRARLDELEPELEALLDPHLGHRGRVLIVAVAGGELHRVGLRAPLSSLSTGTRASCRSSPPHRTAAPRASRPSRGTDSSSPNGSSTRCDGWRRSGSPSRTSDGRARRRTPLSHSRSRSATASRARREHASSRACAPRPHGSRNGPTHAPGTSSSSTATRACSTFSPSTPATDPAGSCGVLFRCQGYRLLTPRGRPRPSRCCDGPSRREPRSRRSHRGPGISLRQAQQHCSGGSETEAWRHVV